MKETDLETKSAGYWAYAAARDARIRAVAMWSHYKPEQQVEAERVKLGLEMVYYYKNIYVNPREKFITVKVENARVKDSKGLKFLEEEWETRGYKKAVSDQGIIYRIPKK
jgi:hypothetical protein